MAKKEDREKLSWSELESTSATALYNVANAYTLRYIKKTAERTGFTPSCDKCENPEENKEEEDDDNSKSRNIGERYAPLYAGCERALPVIKPETGSFLTYVHSEGMKYLISDEQYNPSNVNDLAYTQISYSSRPMFSGFQGIIVVNECLSKADTINRIFNSVYNRSREITKAQISANTYDIQAYDSLYYIAADGTIYAEDYESFTYYNDLISSSIRSAIENEYRSLDPILFDKIKDETTILLKELYSQQPIVKTQEEKSAVITYISGRMSSMYSSVTPVGLRNSAIEASILAYFIDESTKKTDLYSPTISDLLNRRSEALQAYLDKRFVHIPDRTGGSSKDDENDRKNTGRTYNKFKQTSYEDVPHVSNVLRTEP